MKLKGKLKTLYLQHTLGDTTTWIMPEPPRNGTIRLYNTVEKLFVLIGADTKMNWYCLAHRLDLTLNYWDKTPASKELVYWRAGRFYVVSVKYEELFDNWDGCIKFGAILYKEDTFAENLSIARELGAFQADILLKTNPPKIKRKRKAKKEPVNEQITNNPDIL